MRINSPPQFPDQNGSLKVNYSLFTEWWSYKSVLLVSVTEILLEYVKRSIRLESCMSQVNPKSSKNKLG